MNIFQSIQAWITTKNEKRIAEMKNLGLCPDCKGRGINTIALNGGLISLNPLDYQCPSCHGSGSFADWEQFQQQ